MLKSRSDRKTVVVCKYSNHVGGSPCAGALLRVKKKTFKAMTNIIRIFLGLDWFGLLYGISQPQWVI